MELHNFTDLNRVSDVAPCVAALEAFDAIPELQELKALAGNHAGIGPGTKLLDVGCGFGLWSLKLAALVDPGGQVTGIDKSAAFIKAAKMRAKGAKAGIDFQVGDAQDLPFEDGTFDVARSERVLLYLPDPTQALKEMRRVTKKGGAVTAIEPDFGTNAINVADRDLARRVLNHECDFGIPHGLLVRDMAWLMHDVGLKDVNIDTRIVIFPPDLAAFYFAQTGWRRKKPASSARRNSKNGPRRSRT